MVYLQLYAVIGILMTGYGFYVIHTNPIDDKYNAKLSQIRKELQQFDRVPGAKAILILLLVLFLPVLFIQSVVKSFKDGQ